MGGNVADQHERAEIRRLASNPSKVEVSTTATYDLMARGLTKEDICDEIVAWIDNGERVKRVTLRGRHAGQAAFEMKPRINGSLLYVKVTLCRLTQSDEFMLIISAHPDH
jgi:hypothetical protein